MEPKNGSSSRESIDNLAPTDIYSHRSRMSTSVDQSLLVVADSGYGSTYNVTPYNSSNVSSNLSSISSPQRINNNNNNNSNLITIPEISDSTKLTPVTQNIRKITNFHITTPKSNDFPKRTKRHSITALNFEDYHSTPKKLKIDHVSTGGDSAVQSLEYTPRRLKRSRSQKKLFRQRLRSAPDFGPQLEGENMDVENAFSPYQSNFSPIRSKIQPREKRTPLSNVNANLMQASTPKSCGCRLKGTAINFTEKSPSVKKLLSFSDQQFENLINSGVKSTGSQTPIKDNGSLAMEEYETPVKQIRLSSSDKLADTSTNSGCKTLDIYQEQSFREYNKRIYPVLNSVFNDREFAKRRDIETRLEHNTELRSRSPPLNSGLANVVIFHKSKTPSIDATVRGFPQVLDEVPTCSDTEILSTLETPIIHSPPAEFEWIYESEINYNLETVSDIELNKTIQCNPVQVTPIKQNSLFLQKDDVLKTLHSEALEKLPKTSKKQKLYSVDQQQVDILYPPIPPRTPSKKSPVELEWIYKSEINYNLKTDSDIELNQTIKCDSVQVTPLKQRTQSVEKDDVLKTLYSEALEKLPRTPKKQKLCSVDQERLDILYPTIPHTPSKKPYISSQTQLKRKQPEKRSRKFFNGITHLNIIAKLETYTLVLDKIFQLLSSQDLLNLTRVSKSWKRIVRSNGKASARLKKYLQDWKLSKENAGEHKVYENLSLKKLVDSKKNERLIRVPFSQNNKNERKRSLDVQNSPPVSPSKRKFHENQKVVRTLAENEKLTKCPRCAKSSRIINTPPIQDPNENHHNGNSTFAYLENNGHAFPKYFQTFQATTSTFYSLSNENNNYDVPMSQPGFNLSSRGRFRGKLIKSMSADSGLIKDQANEHLQQQQQRRRLSLPFRPFAECSGLVCRFRFCLECLCEYHPGSRCKLTEPISPSKEDLQNGILQVNSASASRSLKSRRKSLKRLCF